MLQFKAGDKLDKQQWVDAIENAYSNQNETAEDLYDGIEISSGEEYDECEEEKHNKVTHTKWINVLLLDYQ